MNTHHYGIKLGANRQRGITMFEVMVTLGIVTIWLLATAGVQTSSAKLNKAAQFRTQAVINASDMVERIEANKTAPDAGYECGGSNTACIPAASTMPSCTGAAGRANCDRWEWATRLVATLPFADAASTSIVWTAGVTGVTPATYTITIGWTDRGDSRTTGNTEPSTYQVVKSIN
jgi:type IV pilus modification protein PilV